MERYTYLSAGSWKAHAFFVGFVYPVQGYILILLTNVNLKKGYICSASVDKRIICLLKSLVVLSTRCCIMSGHIISYHVSYHIISHIPSFSWWRKLIQVLAFTLLIKEVHWFIVNPSIGFILVTGIKQLVLLTIAEEYHVMKKTPPFLRWLLP